MPSAGGVHLIIFGRNTDNSALVASPSVNLAPSVRSRRRPVTTDDTLETSPPGRFLVTCTAGAEGKCVRFGYKPWGDGAGRLAAGALLPGLREHGAGRLLRRRGGPHQGRHADR